MSCYFCESNLHLSANCDIHVSNESRKTILDSKNLCRFCLEIKTSEHKYSRCRPVRKCFICFSRNHDSVLCPNRFSAPSFFIPNIDVVLFVRFLQMFDSIEQYPLALTFSKMRAATKKLKPLKVVEKLQFYRNNYSNRIWEIMFSPDFNDENITIRVLEMEKTWMHSDDFRRLLSCNIQILKCTRVWFTTNILFSEIIKSAPNITVLEWGSLNVDITSDWPADLLKHKNGNNMKSLKIKVKSLEFCVKTLFEFMKKQLAVNIHVIHKIDPTENFDLLKYREAVVEKFSDYFIQANPTTEIISQLCIAAKYKGHYHDVGNFLLKM